MSRIQNSGASSQNVTQNYSYDTLNQLTKATYEDGSSEEFIYDKSGNRLSLKTSVSSVVNSSFNSLNQLLKSELSGADPSAATTIPFEGRITDKNTDKVFVNGVEAVIEGGIFKIESITLQTGKNTLTVKAVDKAGNETTETVNVYFDPKASVTYTYDLNGNLIMKSEKGVVWNYSWDAENRLVRVTTKSTKVTDIQYGYFDNGNRAWKMVVASSQESVASSEEPESSLTYFVHDGIHVIAEYSLPSSVILSEAKNPVLTKEYLYSNQIDEVLSSVIPATEPESSSYYYFHQDGLNSVIAVTDSAGASVASYNYSAFGSLRSVIPAQAGIQSFSNDILYTGRTFENETGDYFYRARYYDAGNGRFTSKDPIGLSGMDYNFYRYVMNNASNYIDPMGWAYFAKRPLDAAPLKNQTLAGPVYYNNPILNWADNELYHEQLFFEDGELPWNVGFFKDRGVDIDSVANIPQYTKTSTGWNDCIMRQAVAEVESGVYSLKSNNCQHYASKLRKKYKEIEKSKNKK